MTDRIAQTLLTLFERHRIVFWYDEKAELRSEYEELELENVVKAEITNNEFGLKYRLLREEPRQQLLLYHEGKKPDSRDNWLLDVLLANGEFSADQVSIWRTELNLDFRFDDIVAEHQEFYKAVKRRESLKKMISDRDTKDIMRIKMIAVCADTNPDIDSITETLLLEESQERGEKLNLITRCKLDEYLWKVMKDEYDYTSEESGILDFAVALFKSCYYKALDAQGELNDNSVVFFRRWKDNRRYEDAFRILSNLCADKLGIEGDLNRREYRELDNVDYFELVEKKVISDIVNTINHSAAASVELLDFIRRRRQGHWYSLYRYFYDAIDYAVQFFDALRLMNTDFDGVAAAVRCYQESWYRIDQLYRKFIYNVGCTKNSSLMGVLIDSVENHYSNSFLLKVNDKFQSFIDKQETWQVSGMPSQKSFYNDNIMPFLKNKKKVCVVISDALRYEIGAELNSLINQEDRYYSEIKGAVSVLPSYTQLGMAALLPHKSLEIADNDTSKVFADGMSSQGIAGRKKILEDASDGRATAIKAVDFMELNRDEYRELFKAHEVIYIYHNVIDIRGDKRESEGQVFGAVEEALQEIINIIKKLTNANATNIIVTADHGFIYQDKALDESEFVGENVSGEEILFKDRRFIIGHGLADSKSMCKYSAEQLGLSGDVEVQIPKSINRLRLKGAGSRYVHGGASLQEVVIPVIKINKARQSDVGKVEVEVLRGENTIISTGQLAVKLYQVDAVTEKMKPRILKVGIYTEAGENGELISDSQEVIFDKTFSDAREREFSIKLILSSNSNTINGQDVYLKLQEKVARTSYYETYKAIPYVLRRSFTSDFDF